MLDNKLIFIRNQQNNLVKWKDLAQLGANVGLLIMYI